MKIKLISIIAVIAMGIMVLLMTVSGYAAIENEYESYLARARMNAEKQIPYNAYNYYLKAFSIRCDDESIYQEYIEQANLLGSSFYAKAVKEYIAYFPESSTGYEMLCQLQYDSGSYRVLLDTALEARSKGVATEQVKNLYNECAYMLRTLKSGLEEAQSFLGGYAMVKVNGLYGYVKANGEFLLAPFYKEASSMNNASAAVNDGEEWHIINSGGYKVARTSVPVDYMGVLVGGRMPVSKGGKYAYTTSALIIPEELPYDYASNFKGGVAAVKKDGKWALIDSDESLITDFIFEDVVLDEFDTCHNGGVIFVKKDGVYHMINAQGAKITDQTFQNVQPFAGTEPAAVCIDGKWGFVNTSGQIVIEPQYENARSFSIGLGAVCVNGQWGYINSSGAFRVECQYEDCKPFNYAGIAAVKRNGFWEYVQLLAYQN